MYRIIKEQETYIKATTKRFLESFSSSIAIPSRKSATWRESRNRSSSLYQRLQKKFRAAAARARFVLPPPFAPDARDRKIQGGRDVAGAAAADGENERRKFAYGRSLLKSE